MRERQRRPNPHRLNVVLAPARRGGRTVTSGPGPTFAESPATNLEVMSDLFASGSDASGPILTPTHRTSHTGVKDSSLLSNPEARVVGHDTNHPPFSGARTGAVRAIRAIHLSRLHWCDALPRLAGWCPVPAFARRVPDMVRHGRGLLGLSGVAALAGRVRLPTM